MSGRWESELRSELAHALKTPLAVIRGYGELLQLRSDERTRRESPARILEAVAELSTRLDDVIERIVRSEGQPPVPAGPSGAVRRLLVVDDDAALRALLAATFPAEEFEVVAAATVKEGLELAERERPDLVVLDWRLPDGSGADVLARLRQRYPELPVIVLTAEREAETGGADGHLVKPFSPVGLLSLVERLAPPN